jgi:DNA-binding transcriptional LysR family regulator
MKIDDIDAFVEVIRCQSISHAAESLQLTQPAITRRVQNFEQALGVELFDRNTKPLKPTLIGTRVYEQCRLILREMDALRELVATDAPPTGVLRLGVPQTIGDVVLLDALKHLRSEYPDLRAQVATGWGSQLVGKIERGELDAAAALFPAGKIFPDNVIGQSIGKMELVVVCAKTQLPKKPCKLADVYQHGWILNPDGCGFRAGLQRTLSGSGPGPAGQPGTFGTELQLGLVADGLGLGRSRALARTQCPSRATGGDAAQGLQAGDGFMADLPALPRQPARAGGCVRPMGGGVPGQNPQRCLTLAQGAAQP